MFLPDFDYYAPDDLSEACGLLAEFGARAKVLAGGTDLLHKMKLGSLTPEILVSLRNLSELRAIRHTPGEGLVIGALATHNDLMNSPVIHQKYLSISQAAHQMASQQIRNLGTVGGNIVNAVPSADLPPILIALGARIELVGSGGSRTMPLEEFFTGAGQSVIGPDEILTRIVIPDTGATGSTYIKFGLRRSGALSVTGVAVAVTTEGDTIRWARIVLGSSGPTVLRAREAEEYLQGKQASDAALAEAGKLASKASRARDSIRGSSEYRRHLAGVLTKRALRKAVREGHV